MHGRGGSGWHLHGMEEERNHVGRAGGIHAKRGSPGKRKRVHGSIRSGVVWFATQCSLGVMQQASRCDFEQACSAVIWPAVLWCVIWHRRKCACVRAPPHNQIPAALAQLGPLVG